MRLIKNPSLAHSKEKINFLRQNNASIYDKDFSQYNFQQIELLKNVIIESRKKGLKSESIKWISMFVKAPEIDLKTIKEDYIPLLITYEANKASLKKIFKYDNISELTLDIEGSSKDIDIVKEKDFGFIAERDGWMLYMPLTVNASRLLGQKTEWCTSRTKSQNLFLNYVGSYEKDRLLFYIIQMNGNPIKNPNSKISVVFEKNVPDLTRKNGGGTVNSVNNGLNEMQIKEILGNNLFDFFLKKMIEISSKLEGKHPIKKDISIISNNYDLLIKKESQLLNTEDRISFLEIISEYPISNIEVMKYLAKNKERSVKAIFALSFFDLPDEILQILSKDKDIEIRAFVAERSDISEEIMKILANDKEKDVKTSLARNKLIPENVMKILAIDNYQTVRYILAGRSSITESIQLMLAKDPDINIRLRLAKNKKLFESAAVILRRDVNLQVRTFAQINPNIVSD